MLRYAITAGEHGRHPSQTASLLDQARSLAESGVDYLQLREKHLPAGEMVDLARKLLAILAESPTRLLINTRADIALAARAHGVHLTSSPGSFTPTQIRTLYRSHRLPTPTVSQTCHTLSEILATHRDPPNLILFSPVFGKTLPETDLPGTGLAALATACAFAHPTPVLALGGVTHANTPSCLTAGAAGIAGIRLFERQF